MAKYLITFAIIILCLFGTLLITLAFPKFIGGLPSLKKILDVNNKEYSGLNLFASSCLISIYRVSSQDQSYLKFTICNLIPFENVSIEPRIFIGKKKDSLSIQPFDFIKNVYWPVDFNDLIECTIPVTNNQNSLQTYSPEDSLEISLTILPKNTNEKRLVFVEFKPLIIKQLLEKKAHTIFPNAISMER